MISQKDGLTTDTSELLILGSSSFARRQLLESIGLTPDTIATPDVDESVSFIP